MRMDPIAIVGIGSIFPGSTDTQGFWRDIVTGRDLMTDIPATHWLIEDYYDPDPTAPDKTYSKRGAFLPEVPFDFMKYGIPPTNLPSTDTSQLLGLMVAEVALIDATQGKFPHVDRERIAVILGHTGATELLGDLATRTRRPRWEEALRRRGLPESELQQIADEIAAMTVPWTEASFPGLLGNVVAGRIANRLDLHGTNCVVDAACASSLAALNMGIAELTLNASDMVLVGGIDTLNDPFMYMCFSKTPALSRTDDCRPFSEQADGTMLGEGVAMIALRRLEDAEHDGDRIYAVIRGIGTSSDGSSKSVYAPVPEGQARALRRAYASAGYSPETVELVEAHGTATLAGDAAEFSGLRQVFEETGRNATQWCALGSVKSQIGHTKCTAGIAGLLKATMALHHKVLPPTIKVTQPNQSLGIEHSPFYLNTETRPWIRNSRYPRRASVSSFGFGGSNFHVTLEEYTGTSPRPHRIRQAATELLVWSARTPEDLSDTLRTFCGTLTAATESGSCLDALARESQNRFNAELPSRLAIVAEDRADLVQKLGKARQSLASAPTTGIDAADGIYYAHNADYGQVAFIFAGQGSQYVNMGRDLAIMFDSARKIWDRSAAVDFHDLPLREVVFPRPAFSDTEEQAREQQLRQPHWSQPAIAVCALAQLAVLQQLGLEPDVYAGHSFGELLALHAAGVFDEATLLRLARKRGELMADTSTEDTSMTAVFASAEAVNKFVERFEDVVIANYNSPTQTVISGSVRTLVAIESQLNQAKISCQRLSVGAAFHSPFMQASVAPFTDYLNTLEMSSPKTPVFACGTAEPYGDSADDLMSSLANQLHQPIRFAETMQALYAAGCRTFVEIGPGSALTALARDILPNGAAHCIALDRRGRHGVTNLWHALARLTVLGVPLRLQSLSEEFFDVVTDPIEAPGKHSVLINGANYGRPYPPRAATATGSPTAARLPKNHADPPAPVATTFRGSKCDTGPVSAGSAVFLTESPFDKPELNQRASSNGGGERCAAPTDVRVHENEYGSGQIPTASSAESQNAAPLIGTSPTPDIHAVSHTSQDNAWLLTLQALERSTAQAEREFQDALARSYEGYLAAMQTAQETLEHLPGPGTAPALQPENEPPMERTPDRRDQLGRNDVGDPTAAPPSTRFPQPAVAADRASVPAIASMAALDNPPIVHDTLENTLLTIVSDKTGYPQDLLDLDLDIESGLGIDSIKRVEIFSALQSQAPHVAAQVEPADLLKLATLGNILDFLRAQPTPADPVQEVPAASDGEPEPTPAITPNGHTDTLENTLLTIVSDKTGYPQDLLDLDLDIESGLGIDSIKRVEIFSALQSQAPHVAAQVEPADLLKLATLGDVLRTVAGSGLGAPDPTKEPGPSFSKNGSTRTFPDRPDAGVWRGEVEAIQVPATGLTVAGLREATPLTIVARGFSNADLETETAFCLAKLLSDKGLKVRVATEVASDSRGVIFLGGIRLITTPDQGLEVNYEAFLTAKAFARTAEHDGGIFITVQDTEGNFGVSGAPGLRPWIAGLAGLTKVAALEWPKASTKAIDLDCGNRPPEELAAAIANELFYGGPTQEVGLGREGHRRVVHVSHASPAEHHAPALADNDVVVVSGGARGVTFEALIELTRHHRLRLVLLGRTHLRPEPTCCEHLTEEPSLTAALLQDARSRGQLLPLIDAKKEAQQILAQREITVNLSRLEATGTPFRYESVDVLNEIAVRRLLKDVREKWGSVRGVVHAAGVLNDKLIRDKTPEHFHRVVRTKVVGLQHLLEATKEDPLSFLCLFSSVAARSGNVGQCDYAMANEIMNKLANAERKNRGGSCLVKSVNWGPWELGMVTPELKTRFEKAGVALLSCEDGARAFVNEVLTESTHSAEVLLLGKPARGPENEVPLSLPGQNRGYVAELELTRERFPFIDDHQIQGTPILPVVMVLEFFSRMAQAIRPGLTLRRIRDLRVFSGVRLADFGTGCCLRIACHEASSSTDPVFLAMELLGGEQKHYGATAELSNSAISAQGTSWADSFGEFTQPDLDPYHGTLFHGASFRVIESLELMNQKGARAKLRTTADLNWPGGPWLIDPAALDGGLQLAVVWTIVQCGFKSLPMAMEEFLIYPAQRPIAACELRAGATSRIDARFDLVFLDAQNNPVSEMRNIVMTMEPQTAALAAS